MHFSVQHFTGANFSSNLSVRPQYQDQRKEVPESGQRIHVKDKGRVTGPLGSTVHCSILLVFDVFHHKVQRKHSAQEARNPNGQYHPFRNRPRPVRCHSTDDRFMAINCYGNDGANGSAVEDIRERVKKLAHYPPQGPIFWVGGFDKGQRITYCQYANICNSQVEDVLVYSGFIGAVCACDDDN